MPVTRNKPTVPHLRGLPASRHGAIALALLCAVAAAGIILFALGQYKSNLQTSAKQETVLVSTGLIQKGTSGEIIGSQNLVRPVEILVKAAKPGALTDATELQGKVAVANILPGTQLVAADFTASLGVQTELAPNQRAIAMTLDPEHGLTSLLEAGDHVDIYGSYNVQPPTGQSIQVARLLVPNAVVLRSAAGGAAGGALSGGATGSEPLLMAVDSNDVGQLSMSLDKASIWLVLRPANATQPQDLISTIQTIIWGVYATSPKVKVGSPVPAGLPPLTVVGEAH